MAGTLPFDLDNLAAGAVRVLAASLDDIASPISTPKSAFLQETPYTAATHWFDIGAKTGPMTYDRNLTVQSYKIEEQSSAVLETPDELIRQIHIPMAEIRPDILAMFEGGGTVGAIAAAAHASAFASVKAGSITDLATFRVVFVGQRQKVQGVVIESDGTTKRGRFYGAMIHRATITADSSTVSFGKGNLASATLTLKLFPDPSLSQGVEYIEWFDEAAGTIASV